MLSLLLDARAGATVPAMDARVSTGMQAATRTSGPADVMALQALGQWAAIAMAPMQGLTRMCGPDAADPGRDSGLRSDCVALFSRIAADDSTLLYAQLATGLLIRLAPGLASEWTPRMRELAWRQEQSVPLIADFSGTPAATEYAGWVAGDGELGAMAKLLVRAGIPATPPAHWELPRPPR